MLTENSYTRIFCVVLKKFYPCKVAIWSFVANNLFIALAAYDSELLSFNISTFTSECSPYFQIYKLIPQSSMKCQKVSKSVYQSHHYVTFSHCCSCIIHTHIFFYIILSCRWKLRRGYVSSIKILHQLKFTPTAKKICLL